MIRDRPAWTADELHQEYLAYVFRFVSRRIPRREEAEDVTASVFGAAFRSLNRLRRQDDPRLWLLGIARRVVADSLRKRERRREVLESELTTDTAMSDHAAEGAGDPERRLWSAERRRTIRRILNELGADQRDALLLKYLEGLSIREIAVVLGRSEAAANSLLQRARATALREGSGYFLEHSIDRPVATRPEGQV